MQRCVAGTCRRTKLTKRIDIVSGNQQRHALGRTVFSCILDEAYFRERTNQMKNNYIPVKRRMQSRF